MPTFDSWIANAQQIAVGSSESRAALAWRRINDRPDSIVIYRGSGTGRTTLSAQTVRVESNDTARFFQGQVNTIGRQLVTVFGIQGHATLPDTNIQRGDRFTRLADGITYEVIMLLTPPGEIQAICEASA